jgi:hypothetical protein
MRSFHKFSQRTSRFSQTLQALSCYLPRGLTALQPYDGLIFVPSRPLSAGLKSPTGCRHTQALSPRTGTAILGSDLLATAILQELCVFNEETVIAVGYFILFAYIAKVRTLPWGVNFSFCFLFFSWGAFR